MPKAHICLGKDCRKEAGLPKLTELLGDAGVKWVPVECQKVCKGPVVGLKVDQKLEWFAPLRGKSARRALRAFLEAGDRESLWKLRVKKRSGKRR